MIGCEDRQHCDPVLVLAQTVQSEYFASLADHPNAPIILSCTACDSTLQSMQNCAMQVAHL